MVDSSPERSEGVECAERGTGASAAVHASTSNRTSIKRPLKIPEYATRGFRRENVLHFRW